MKKGQHRQHALQWHRVKFPALTAKYDACYAKFEAQHETGEFNRWALAVLEAALTAAPAQPAAPDMVDPLAVPVSAEVLQNLRAWGNR